MPVRTLPHLVIRATGLAVPMMRELEEVRYQFTEPFVEDSLACTRTFGDAPTALDCPSRLRC